MKKRRLLFFANIAILSLSVFLFVFGVYSANIAQVKSGGKVEFTATNIYAKITRTVSGYDTSKGNVVASESKIIDARTEVTAGSAVLSFDDEMYFDEKATEIVMTFEIENLSVERNLDFSFTRNNTTQTNISDVATVSAHMYDATNKIYNINPKADNVKNIETITIKFNVEDWDAAGILDYDYTINLSNQTKLSSNIQSTSNLTRVGNTYVATSTLESGNQVGYKYTGTSYYEYAPAVTDTNTITSAIHVFKSDVTAITIMNEAINTTNFVIKPDTYGGAKIEAQPLGVNEIGTDTCMPVAVNDATHGVMIITSLPNSSDSSSGTPAFDSTYLGLTGLPGGIVFIGNAAFYNCSYLALTSLPEGVATISEEAFKNCSRLNLSNLPGKIASIGNEAFSGCSGLTFTTLPESLTIIGDKAFNNCDGLTNIVISKSVTNIGLNPFRACYNLTEIVVEDGNTKYTSSETNNMIIDTETNTLICGLNSVTSILDSVTRIEQSAFAICTNLALTSLPSGVTEIGNSAFYNCTNLALTSLPSGVTEIGSSAFYSCTNLILTSLPEGITSIASYTFYNCTNLALTSLPSGINEIGDYAFYGCTNLKLYTGEDPAVYFPENLISIGNYAFQNCTSLIAVFFYEGLESMGISAFKGCSSLIALAQIPVSLISVGNSAFNGCVLTTINYNGTTDQWNAIGNISNAGITAGAIVYTSDGSVQY